MTTEDTTYFNGAGRRIDEPQTNWTVLRLKQPIFGNSTIGLIGLNKDPQGGDYNRGAGLDWDLRLGENWLSAGYVAKTDHARPRRPRQRLLGGPHLQDAAVPGPPPLYEHRRELQPGAGVPDPLGDHQEPHEHRPSIRSTATRSGSTRSPYWRISTTSTTRRGTWKRSSPPMSWASSPPGRRHRLPLLRRPREPRRAADGGQGRHHPPRPLPVPQPVHRHLVGLHRQGRVHLLVSAPAAITTATGCARC